MDLKILGCIDLKLYLYVEKNKFKNEVFQSSEDDESMSPPAACLK